MFRGLTALTVDVKGRITIPSQYRDRLTDEAHGQVVITIDTEERCLLVYPFLQWQLIEEKLQALPSFLPASRRIQRLLIGHAMDIELDRFGRALLPTLLREYAGIEKDVVLVGQGNKFELWDESEWKRCRESWLHGGMDDPNDLPPELQSFSL